MTRSFFVIAISIFITTSVLAKTASEEGTYTYEGLLAIGHGQYIAQNYSDAIIQYEKAKNADPGRADAYYFIGCAMKQQKRYDEAVTILKSAATVAGDKNPALHAKSLFVVALILEMANQPQQAKFAWAEYKTYASSHPDAHPHVAVAEQRVAVIEENEKLNAKYQVVRDRIANATEQ